jgi:purine-binding chemotaxis protein CheW
MATMASGVHRLNGQLMVVLDVDKVLELNVTAQAA